VSQSVKPNGLWQNVKNLRSGIQCVYVRDGIQSVFSTPLPSGCSTLVDWWSGNLNGTEYLFGAFRESGGSPKIRIYYFQNSGGLSSGSSWTEITSASGDYGNTRLDNSQRVTFCKYKNDFLDQSEGVYISNGTQVRFFNLPNIYPVGTPNTPSGGDQFKMIATYGSYFAVASSSGKTYTNSGANFTLANTTTAPYTSANTCILLSRNTTAATNPTAQVAFASGLNVSRNQFWMVLEGSSTNIATMLDRIKIELSDGLTYTTIYDKSSTSSQFGNVVGITVLVSGTTQIQHVVFSINPATVLLSNTTTVRFTWVGAAPTAAVAVNILGMGLSGRFPGSSQWGISYFSPGFVETGAYLTNGLAETPLLSAIGGPTQVTGNNAAPNLGLPVASFLYDYELLVANALPGSGHIPIVTAGMSYGVNLYYRLAAGVDFRYHTSIFFATPGGNFNSPDANVKLSTYASGWNAIRNGPEFAYAGITAPLGGNVAPPPGLSSSLYANRLFIGGVYVNNTSRLSEIWFSYENVHTRFQEVVETDSNGSLDPLSGGVATLPASCLGLLHTGGQSFEWSILFAFTNSATYTIGGINRRAEAVDSATFTTVSLYAHHGVAGYRAYCSNIGAAFIVDNYGRFVLLNEKQPMFLGFNRFDSKLQSVPAAAKGDIVLAARGPRIYIGYTPFGQTSNTQLLVYNLELKELESIDTSGSESFQRIVTFTDKFAQLSQGRILVYSNSGKIGALEESSVGDFGGTGIDAELVSNRMITTDGYWFIDRVRVSGDKDAAATATVTRYYPANTWTSTLPFQHPDAEYTNQFDCGDSVPDVATGSSTTPQGSREASVGITWTGTPKKKIEGITIEVKGLSVGAGSR
jgi:hypothetical protein